MPATLGWKQNTTVNSHENCVTQGINLKKHCFLNANRQWHYFDGGHCLFTDHKCVKPWPLHLYTCSSCTWLKFIFGCLFNFFLQKLNLTFFHFCKSELIIQKNYSKIIISKKIFYFFDISLKMSDAENPCLETWKSKSWGTSDIETAFGISRPSVAGRFLLK